MSERGFAQTALGLADWASERCLGEFATTPDAVSTGVPALTPAQAYAKGARGLVIGVADRGGVLDPAWTRRSSRRGVDGAILSG